MSKRVLLKDVAEKAKVSTALVSYVLNNKAKEARVNPETAKRVREIARKMHYYPNQIAKSLKSGKTLAIGAILADISNPFFAQLARTIENESEKKDYAVIFGSSDERADTSQKLIETMISRQIDGFIIAPAEGSTEQLTYLRDLNIPYVLIDRYFEDIDCNYVVVDNFTATYEATTQMLNSGFKKIAYLKYKNKMFHTEKRFKGYEKALLDQGITETNAYVCEVSQKDEKSIKKNFRKLLQSHPEIDAVLFSTNHLSVEGLKVILELGKRVPDDIGVFCFDESESYDLFYCPISYVSQPLEEIGKQAVEILIDRLTKRDGEEFNKKVLSTELVIRDSSKKKKK